MNHKDPLPVLARLLPKLKAEPLVVAVPKQPALKPIAAGFAFKPNPPKLNPPAVVFPAPSPPNPAAKAGSEERESNTEEINDNARAQNSSVLLTTSVCLQGGRYKETINTCDA